MATAIAFPTSMEPQRSLSTGGDWVKVELEHAHGDDGLPLDGTETRVANPRARLPVALLRSTNLHVPAILHTHLALLFALLYTYATRILTARLPSIGSPSSSPSASSSQDPSPTGSKYPSTTPSHSSSKQHDSTSGSGSSSSSPTYPTQATFSLSLPASASPFPSPSSSFLPPPVPGVHEFAMKPPPAVLNGGSSNGSNGVGLGINGGGLSVNGGGAGTRSRSSSTRANQNGATANGTSASTLVQGTATSASVNGTGTSAGAGSGDISQLAASDVSGSSTSREGLLSSSLAPTPHTASSSISASTETEAELSSGHSNTEGETKTKTKGEAGAVEGGSTTATHERARMATSAELGGHEAKREGSCGGEENNKGVRGFGASRGEGGDKTEAVKADPEPFKAVPGTEAKISGGKEIGKEVNGKGMDTDIGGMGSKMSKISKASGQEDVDAAPMGSIPPAAASTAPAIPAPTVSTPAPTTSSTTTTSPPPPVFSSHQPQAPLSPTSPVPTSPTTSSSSSSTTQTSAQLKKHQHRVSLPPPSSFPVALGLSTSSSSSSGSGGAVHRQTSSVSSTTSTGSAGAVSPSVSSSTPITVASSSIPSSIPTSIATVATAPMTIATTPSGTIPRTPGPRSRPPSSYFDPTLSPLLASSRPAPPSPALSATSKGGRGSRPVSGVFSLDGFNSGMSGIGMSGIGSGGMSRQNSMKKAKRVSSGLGMSVNLGSPTSARFAPASWLSQSQGQSPLVFGAKADDREREPEDSDREPPPDSAASIESLESNASTVVPDGPGTPGTPGVVFAGFQRERLGQSGGSAAAAVGGEGQDKEEGGGWERAKGKKEGKKRTFYIKIKDFGFEPQDPKFCGMGEIVPKENRVGRLNRVLRGAGKGYDPYAKPPLPPLTTDSTNPEAGAATPTAEEQKRWSQGSWASCSSFPHSPVTPTASSLYGDGYDDEEEEDDDDYGYGWGGGGGGWFRKGLGKLNWAGVGSSASDGQNGADDDEEEDEGYPSAGDLARNFDQDGEDLSGGSGVGGVYDEPDSFDSFADDLDDADDPLYPGIYRALFAFEPEGTAEVRLREDQLVRVVKRGGGVGWAVVEVGWKAGKDLVKELRESGELDDVDVVDGEDGEGDDSEEQEKGSGCTEGGGVEVVMGDGKKLRQGLVPESYLAPVRLDGWVDCS